MSHAALSHATVFADFIRAEADARYGPDGWRSVCTIFLVDVGVTDSVTVLNTRRTEQAAAVVAAAVVVPVPTPQTT
jgi:hypothetical protein